MTSCSRNNVPLCSCLAAALVFPYLLLKSLKKCLGRLDRALVMSELICPCAVLLLQSCVVVSIAEVKRTVPIPMDGR